MAPFSLSPRRASYDFVHVIWRTSESHLNKRDIIENNRRMDDILQEIEDIRKLLSTTKSENLRESLQKRLEELEKNLEEKKKEDEERRSLEQSEKKKEGRKKIKLRSIRKFKIDQEKISEWFSQGKRSISGFINIMAQEIPKYFENNDEFMAYVDASSYLALRIKFRFTKDSSPGHEVDHVFFLISSGNVNI
jgi:ABC-type uncharacterized transport system fused permease/ATPase subunit